VAMLTAPARGTRGRPRVSGDDARNHYATHTTDSAVAEGLTPCGSAAHRATCSKPGRLLVASLAPLAGRRMSTSGRDGRAAITLARGATVIGMDASAQMLSVAFEGRVGWPAHRVRPGDAQPAVLDRSFDAAVCLRVTAHRIGSGVSRRESAAGSS
jgi:hypothetical protein